MRFQKGQSGNPNGRPRKGRALSDLLRAVGNRTENGIANKRRLADTVWDMALGGDLAAIRLIYEYCDGKPVQKVNADVTSGGLSLALVDFASLTDDDLREIVSRGRRSRAGEPDAGAPQPA